MQVIIGCGRFDFQDDFRTSHNGKELLAFPGVFLSPDWRTLKAMKDKSSCLQKHDTSLVEESLAERKNRTKISATPSAAGNL
jgi:hypothetical protein